MNRLSPNQECALHFISRPDVARHVAPPNKWRIPQNLILVCGGQASQSPSHSADCPGCFVVVDAFLLVCLLVVFFISRRRVSRFISPICFSPCSPLIVNQR